MHIPVSAASEEGLRSEVEQAVLSAAGVAFENLEDVVLDHIHVFYRIRPVFVIVEQSSYTEVLSVETVVRIVNVVIKINHYYLEVLICWRINRKLIVIVINTAVYRRILKVPKVLVCIDVKSIA